MQLPFGLTISRRQALNKKSVPAGFMTLERSRGWTRILEGFTGAWQANIVASTEDVLTYAAVYACVTLKATDIAKLRIKLMQQDADGIWTETENPAYSPVLREPNHFQTHIEFLEQWMHSKFIQGNTYALLHRDNRGGEKSGNVIAMYVLDPNRVKVLVAKDGSIYYSISSDPLAKQELSAIVPASEIIHDKMNPLFHPLYGVSPITACGLAATQGLRVQNQSTRFFENGSQPSGVVSFTDDIDDDDATAIQKRWEEQFSGPNTGRVAVLGMGASYKPMMMSAIDAQLIDQLKWTAEQVCTAYHVPPFMVGVGAMPTYNNIEALNQQYYSQALQGPIEHLEALLDKGLGMKPNIGTELDLSGLMRMDTLNRTAAAEKAIKSGMSPDEVRRHFYDLGKVKGGANPLFQQQNFSLEALAKRDAKADPFETAPAPAPATPTETTPADAKAILMKAFSDELRPAA